VAAATDPFQALAAFAPGKSWKSAYQRLVELFAKLFEQSHSLPALYELVLAYYQPIFERLYHDDFPKRRKDIDQLKGIMDGYGDLQSFIDDTSLDPPEESRGNGEELNRLVLSTIHSAKGLEFAAVFVIGMAEGRFPHAAASFGEQWEEERRLLYVAVTRAKKHLYLTYPKQLMSQDRQFHRVGMSPFLGEMGRGYYQRATGSEALSVGLGGAVKVPAVTTVRKARPKKLEVADFVVGAKVNHPFFGNGTVVKKPSGRSLDILFDRHGLKTLHLDYAKLSII
jgi:DNA helicase-2/ATP-dependent DNA helicase PcrA